MITIFENGKYILHLPNWANNVYLKLEELPYKEGLCVLEISYRDKKAYCLYHSGLKRHTLWVDRLEELDKRYRDGEIDPLRGIVVYDTDMWGDEVTVPIEVICGEVFGINGKWLRGILTLRREIDTITCGMYPVGYLRYDQRFDYNYPKCIDVVLDFADPTANISVELLDQL